MGVWWSKENHLQLNVSKIKGLVVDFRQSEKLLTPVIIQGEEVEMVQTYKYLCVNQQTGTDLTKKRWCTREGSTDCSSKGDLGLHNMLFMLNPGRCDL